MATPVETAFDIAPVPMVVLALLDGEWVVEAANRRAVDLFGDAVGTQRLPWPASGRDRLAVQRACADLVEGTIAQCCLAIEAHGTTPTDLVLRRLDGPRPVVLVHAAGAPAVHPDETVVRVDHELRTPLTSVIGYAEVLLSGAVGDLDPRQERMIARIARNAWRVVDHIETMVVLSRVSSRSAGDGRR